MISTCPTPRVPSRRGRTTLSAYSVMSRMGRSAESASVMTGMAPGSNLEITGGAIPAGGSRGGPLVFFPPPPAPNAVVLFHLKLGGDNHKPSAQGDHRPAIPPVVVHTH